jgi:hypothetical protein
MDHIEELLAIVRRGDAVEIEGARDLVKREDMDALAAAYWRLPSLDERSGLMQLFSDHLAPPMAREVMLDFLKNPDDPAQLNNEYVTSGKVVALCQLEGSFANGEKYWNNRALLNETAERYLSGKLPPPARPKKNWWQNLKRSRE